MDCFLYSFPKNFKNILQNVLLNLLLPLCIHYSRFLLLFCRVLSNLLNTWQNLSLFFWVEQVSFSHSADTSHFSLHLLVLSLLFKICEFIFLESFTDKDIVKITKLYFMLFFIECSQLLKFSSGAEAHLNYTPNCLPNLVIPGQPLPTPFVSEFSAHLPLSLSPSLFILTSHPFKPLP